MAGVTFQEVDKRYGDVAVIEGLTLDPATGDRAVMKDGRIQQVGTPFEIYERPVNLFVAAFVGMPPMNFLPAVVRNGSATGNGFALRLPARLRSRDALPDGSKVVVGLRPENVLGQGEEARGETSPVRLEIEVVEPLGDEVVVHGMVGDTVVICKLDPRHVPEVGSTLDAVVEVEEMHVFDAATERRLGD